MSKTIIFRGWNDGERIMMLGGITPPHHRHPNSGICFRGNAQKGTFLGTRWWPGPRIVGKPGKLEKYPTESSVQQRLLDEAVEIFHNSKCSPKEWQEEPKQSMINGSFGDKPTSILSEFDIAFSRDSGSDIGLECLIMI